MSGPDLPARIGRTLDWLGEVADLGVLEIGCGTGVAVEALLQAQAPSRLRGMDRSPTAVARARERNRTGLAGGRVDFVTASFEDGDDQVWDRVFAINVNAFWVDPGKSFPALARLLAPQGRFLLVWEAPGASRARDIAGRLARIDPPGLRLEPVRVEHALVCLRGEPDPGPGARGTGDGGRGERRG